MLVKNFHRVLSYGISRRRLLKLGLFTAASGIIPVRTMAAVKDVLSSRERSISIYNLHTKEHLDVVYWMDGEYVTDTFKDINHIFRDHYNGTVKAIDTALLDYLWAIQRKLECRDPFHLISGYRSPETNRWLRKRNSGVAKRSLHIRGMAADIRLPGHKIRDVRRAAYQLRCGGVGYYPHSNFIHVDVGEVRFWRG